MITITLNILSEAIQCSTRETWGGGADRSRRWSREKTVEWEDGRGRRRSSEKMVE